MARRSNPAAVLPSRVASRDGSVSQPFPRLPAYSERHEADETSSARPKSLTRGTPGASHPPVGDQEPALGTRNTQDDQTRTRQGHENVKAVDFEVHRRRPERRREPIPT